MYAKLKEEPQKVAETDKYFRLKSSTILLAITEHVVVEGRGVHWLTLFLGKDISWHKFSYDH